MPTRFTAASAVGSLAALLLTVVPVSAAHADDQLRAAVTAAADYIATSASGGADAIIALAAADTQPTALDGMLEAFAGSAAGSAGNAASRGKLMIAADAANLDARFFADASCATNWAETQRADAEAGKLSAYWAPQLVVISLARLGEPAPEAALEKILSTQHSGGAWGYGSGAAFTAQPDDTAMSLYALGLVADSEVEAAETRATARAAIDKAVAWSRSDAARSQLDGNYYWATYSPANSTGLMASALAEVGEDVTSPQAFLAAQQSLTGSGWSNTLNGTKPQLMATTQAILGAAGAGYGTARATGEVTSTCAQPPTIAAQPADVAAPPSSARLTADVTDGDTLQWQRFDGAWVDVDGATSATLSPATEGQYRLTATNVKGSSFSRVATVTLTAEPSPSPSASPSVSPKPDPTPSATPTRTPSPVPDATRTPGATPSSSPSRTATPRPGTPTAPVVDVYTTPGLHTSGGRAWSTACEPYSKTTRCRTEIWATTVALRDGRYVRTTGWAFNNLTYLPSPRALWAGNPLAEKGEWTSPEGRMWRTDCDSAVTGRGGCRNYLRATTVSAVPAASGGWSFVQADAWVFNGIVRFS